MTAFTAISIQSALSMMIFSLLALIYLVPSLRKMPLRQALAPLLWFNAFRYLPLILFAPGQVSASIPEPVTTMIAYGDLLAGLLALTAVLLVTFKISGAMVMTWLFVIVGTLDSLNGVYSALSAEAYQFPLGVSWMIVTFFVPLIFVSEGVIIHQLVTNKNT